MSYNKQGRWHYLESTVASNDHATHVPHLSMGNKIIGNLYGTLIITKNDNRGLDWKTKITRKLPDPNYLCKCIYCPMILCFQDWQGYQQLFLTQLNQRSRVKEKQIIRHGFLIITITFPIWVTVPNQWITGMTIFDTKLISTLDIANNPLCNFLVAFSWILHELGNHTNRKGNARSTTS